MSGYKLSEQFRMELKPITPVHIGGGKSYSKNEYIYLPQKNQIIIPNIPKLFGEIIERKLVDNYQEFIQSEQNKDLSIFLQKNDIEIDAAASWVDYTMELPDMQEEDFKQVEIAACMKNAYGEPYIPGSSLKGAIRTAILGYFAMNYKNTNPENYEKVKKKVDELANIDITCVDADNYPRYKKAINGLKTEINQIEKECFRTMNRSGKQMDILDDYMTTLRISDSRPISKKDIVLTRKVDTFTNGVKNQLNLLRESLLPKEKIVFDISIDVKEKTYINKASIDTYLQEFFKLVQDSFVSMFGLEMYTNSNLLYLGGGTGFASKTVIYALFDKDYAREVVRRILHFKLINERKLKEEDSDKEKPLWIQHGHDVKDNYVSPHTIKTFQIAGKNTCYDNKEMGVCECRII